VKGGGEVKQWKGGHGGESEKTRQGKAAESRMRKNRRVATKGGGGQASKREEQLKMNASPMGSTRGIHRNQGEERGERDQMESVAGIYGRLLD
jgi:hypothetical protein